MVDLLREFAIFVDKAAQVSELGGLGVLLPCCFDDKWWWRRSPFLMAINNVSVQYNGELLLDIIMLTPCDYALGNPFDIMRIFCSYSQCSHLTKSFDNFSPEGADMLSEGLDAFSFL